MISLLEFDALDQRPLTAPRGPALVLVRAGAGVLGEVRIDDFDPTREQEARRLILEQFRVPLLWAMRVEQQQCRGVDPGSFTLVVSRSGRDGVRDGCLASVAALDPPPGEVIVCDGDAWSEPISHHGDILFLLDDDSRPAPDAVGVLAQAFGADVVDAVTTVVRPEVLATWPQSAYDRWFPGIASSFDRGLVTATSWHLPSTFVGTRTSIAVRRHPWECFVARAQISPPQPSDARLVESIRRSRGAVLHEPSAVVRHVRPRDRSELLDAVHHQRESMARVGEHVPRGVPQLRASAAVLGRAARQLRLGQILRAQLELADVDLVRRAARRRG